MGAADGGGGAERSTKRTILEVSGDIIYTASSGVGGGRWARWDDVPRQG